MQPGTYQKTQQHGQNTHRAQQSEKAAENLIGGRAERLEHPDMVIVSFCISMCGKRHGDPGQQHAEQTTKQQEALRPLECGPDGRTAFPDAAPPEIEVLVETQVVSQRFQQAVFALQQQAIGNP